MIAVEVKLWGTTIGALSMLEGESVARFEYAPEFIGAGVEPAPITMPVSNRIYTFSQLSGTFHGLPGLFADSLPDKFGNRVIDAWLLRTVSLCLSRACTVSLSKWVMVSRVPTVSLCRVIPSDHNVQKNRWRRELHRQFPS